MLRIKKNKRGFTANFIVLLVCFIVFAFVGFIFYLLFGLVGTLSVYEISSSSQSQAADYALLNYLRTPVKINEQELIIADIIAMVDMEEGKEQKIDVFQQTAKKIFEDRFPLEHPNWKGVHPWWLRVYAVDEEPSELGNGKYFRVLGPPGKGYIYGPGANCDPQDKKNNLVITSIVPKVNGENVKLVFCIFKSYLRAIE